MNPFLRSIGIITVVTMLLVGGLWLGLDWLGSPVQAQRSTTVPFGVAVTSQVTTRDGEQWHFRGCVSDVVTIVMTSTTFTPYLELTGPESAESMASSEADGDSALIADYSLTASGLYTVWAGGDSRSARGAYQVAIQLADNRAFADIAGMVSYGVPVTGAVATRAGESWGLHACAGDVITINLESDLFDPYLELADPATDESLAEDDNSGAAQGALITNYAFTRTGDYRITALGAKRSDRGEYTLLITAQDVPVPLRPVIAPAATATPTQRTGAAATATPIPAPICTVKVDGLNLRSGPGTIYQPPIGNLPVGLQLRPLARDPSATWIQVQAPGNQTGWVSAGAQYITCGVNIATLPVGVIPPPPTATATPLPTPTQQIAQAPTPTPPAYFGMPGGGGGGGFDGEVRTERGIVADRNNPVFRDRLFLRMEVYQTPNNRSVDHVEFVVQQQTHDGDREVYRHSEGTDGYCLFGGGEPNCNVLSLQPGVTWPDTNTPITDGFYNVDITVFVEGRNDTGNWNTFFEIDIPGQDAGDNQNGGGQSGGESQSDLVVNLVQIGPGNLDTFISDALVFQVEAFNPDDGGADGDGIQNVDLWIYGPDGNEVYHRTENNAHYCAFAGGEPECNAFDLQGNDQWPDGPTIEGGFHTLRWRANAKDGRQVEGSVDIEISR